VKTIFVDGYNVINSWSELRIAKDINLEIARQKLIEILENYATYNNCKLYLVFDAHLKKGSLEKREEISSNIIVIYTKEGETADSYIEKHVNNIGRKIEVSVVTSDSLEQQLVFQRGATRMSSIEFYHEVKGNEQTIKMKLSNIRSSNKSTVEERLDKDILEILEKIRRSD
jgi:predicted RNA-binding protein with PIN domain